MILIFILVVVLGVLAAFAYATAARPEPEPDQTQFIVMPQFVCVACAIVARGDEPGGLDHSRRCGGPCLCPEPVGHHQHLCALCGGRRPGVVVAVTA